MNYIVEYKVFSSIDAVIKAGKIRCKNKATKFEVIAGLSNHLARTVPAFSKMIIISCTEEKRKPDMSVLFEFFK